MIKKISVEMIGEHEESIIIIELGIKLINFKRKKGFIMQVNRLFEIIYILLEKNIVTAKELAEIFEVSQRTIYRDIEALSTAGIPVYMSKGKGGGISILSGFVLNKAILTEEEKLEILSFIRAVNAISFNDKKIEKVFRKLNNILGKNDTDWIEVDFSNWEMQKKKLLIILNIQY
ncbi:putative DNA-binding transcriptional regulator YafY [Clostridium moniliforme]|uniref:DNA-binding transcriptional regulator YafY n=1 Tax=Clostridium moniliforme TaxID=39489 RepID=A0ABS4EXP8_9CLOT|nr:putative DNA-binding transcriptional regulator YafY [Clostridium moniliforme]